MILKRPNLFQVRSLLSIGAIALTACTKALDITQLANDIRATVSRQGGTTLKTVTCPKAVPQEAGKQFDCIGELDSGDTFAIPVQQQDDQGKTTWEVPQTKGLLHLRKLETLFQQTLQQEGQTLQVDCGEGYRSVQPGDRFDCKVRLPAAQQPEKSSKKLVDQATEISKATIPPDKPKAPKLPELIAVMIDPQGNLNWQQVFPAPAPVATASLPAAPTLTETALPQADPAQAAENRQNLTPETLNDLEQRSD